MKILPVYLCQKKSTDSRKIVDIGKRSEYDKNRPIVEKEADHEKRRKAKDGVAEDCL